MLIVFARAAKLQHSNDTPSLCRVFLLDGAWPAWPGLREIKSMLGL